MTASLTHVELRPGAYADSVTLLQVSRDVATTEGVRAAQVAMATELNLEVLASMGFDIPAATPNDMVVALKLDSEDALSGALAAVAGALAAASGGSGGGGETIAAPRSTRAALRRSGPGVALVSVPGQHAFVEAMDALDADSDVMIFSDNMPVEQELVLKQRAAERGLLVMGPDCGTAVVGGLGLGFANTTRPGPVGMVAASGTGCQQLLSLFDHAGVGVSSALGVGGRDLKAEIGGLSTKAALTRLDQDPTVEQIVLVSKPPAASVAAELKEYAAGLGTPVHFALLGPETPSLSDTAAGVLEAMGVAVPAWPTWGTTAEATSGSLLRGLFVGGTMCDEAMLIAGADLGPIRSNIPLSPELALDSSLTADAHLMIDFGDDSLTQGRAHPMIDPTLRLEHLAEVAADPSTGAILMDVVLGHGAEPDPAAGLAPAIVAARKQRDVPVIVACVGTESDPQVLSRQAAALADAGAEVHLSNASATARAVALVSGGAR